MTIIDIRGATYPSDSICVKRSDADVQQNLIMIPVVKDRESIHDAEVECRKHKVTSNNKWKWALHAQLQMAAK